MHASQASGSSLEKMAGKFRYEFLRAAPPKSIKGTTTNPPQPSNNERNTAETANNFCAKLLT
jgi:hypothetical protein